jgi:hypothetical protein
MESHFYKKAPAWHFGCDKAAIVAPDIAVAFSSRQQRLGRGKKEQLASFTRHAQHVRKNNGNNANCEPHL